MTEITQLIGSLGFPIAMCCSLMWYIKNIQDSLKSTVANNTVVLQQILVKLNCESEVKNEDK